MKDKNINYRKINKLDQEAIEDEKSQSFWEQEQKSQPKIDKSTNKFEMIKKLYSSKNAKIEQIDNLKIGILDKKSRKINKAKSKGNQFSSSQQEIIRAKSDNGSENSQKCSFNERNQISEYYSADPEANAYQLNKKSKKNSHLNAKKSFKQEELHQQLQSGEENIENFDWSLLQNQRFSPEKQNIELIERKQEAIDNEPQEINVKFMEKMWKYGIDKLCHSIERMANRSTKLQKLFYVSFKSMMGTIQIMNQNNRKSQTDKSFLKDDCKCYLVTNRKSLDNNNPYSYPFRQNYSKEKQNSGLKQKNQISKYEAMLKQSQAEEEEKIVEIQRHIKDLKNERKRLTESLNLTRKRCRYSEENRNFSKQFQKSIQQSEQQTIRVQKTKLTERSKLIQYQENENKSKMIQSLNKNNRKKESGKINKQIEKGNYLSILQDEQAWQQKEILYSSDEDQSIQLNEIIQKFAVGAQEKSKQTHILNANQNNLGFESQKQKVKIQNQSASNDNFILLTPSVPKYEDRPQVKMENFSKDNVKQEEGFKDKMFKKLEALKRDSEQTKVKRQQQAQQNIQRIAKAKQERQRKAYQTDHKNQNISRANKQILLMKHLNRKLAVKYKRVDYFFSEIDKHLQLSVMDRDTANSISDDNHEKIITISPQLDHQYNLHRVHLRIVNVEYWIAIGICDIDQVKKNRCIMKVRQFGHHGVYMLGSNGFSYSNYIQEDHRIDKGFKFKSGDIIRVNVDSTNCLITFIKNKETKAEKYSMKYNPNLQLCKIRFCAGLCRTKDIIRIQNCKNPFLQ